MSTLEKALRQVAQQRQNSGPVLSVPTLQALPASGGEPGQRVRQLGLAVVLVAMGAGGAWLWHPASSARAPAETRQAPASAPAASASPLQAPAQAAPVRGEFTRPDWVDGPRKLWDAGLRVKAVALWLDALRRQPPSSTALLVAERQTLAQAISLHTAWSGQLPVVALARAADGATPWMVLAVPAHAEIERARELLKATQGQAPVWGSLSHWLAPLEPGVPAPAPAPATAHSPAQAPAQATARAPAAAPAPAPAPAPARAPVAPAAAAATPPAAPAPKATAATPTPPAAPTTSTPSTSASAASAAGRTIDADFQAIETLLARGDHAGARESVERLEQFTGQTWRTRYLAGVALSGLSRWEEASIALTQAQAKNPGHPMVALYQSVALQERNQHAQALRVLTPALDKHPDTPELWLNQGISLQALGFSAEANQALRRFLDVSAGRADLQAQRTWAQGRLKKEP